jgi:hypothetical protein
MLQLPARILLIGRAYSGKSFIADLLERERGYVHLNYAFQVKLEVAQCLGISIDELEREKAKYRRLLQTWGTDFKRQLDPDYWVKKREQILSELDRVGLASTSANVASDGRFPNEIADCIRRGGIVVKVAVEEELRMQRWREKAGRDPLPEELNHPSEAGIDILPYHFSFYGGSPPNEILSRLERDYNHWNRQNK